jgi:hypothetical protein
MYIQMADDRMNAMVENLNTEFKGMTSAAEKIRYLFARFYKQQLHELRRWLTFHLEFTTYSSRQPEITEFVSQYVNKALSVVRRIMEEGKRSGEFRPDLEETAASYLFWSVRDGLALHFLLSGEEEQYRFILKDMENMVFRYIMNTERM